MFFALPFKTIALIPCFVDGELINNAQCHRFPRVIAAASDIDVNHGGITFLPHTTIIAFWSNDLTFDLGQDLA
jgi:hypothetical protein